MLRFVRLARSMSRDDAAVAADITSARLRDLERGTANLEYLEGHRLAKAYSLCPNCFRRAIEDVLEREELTGR
jgi:hypothetical protein